MSDLQSYSLQDLEDLLARIRTEIDVREQERASRPARRTRVKPPPVEQGGAPPTTDSEALQPSATGDAAVAQAATCSMPIEGAATGDLETSPPAPSEVEPEPIRYMHPSNRELTWSGDGAQPAWVEIWLRIGGTLYALEVAAEKLRPRPKPSFAPTSGQKSSSPHNRRFRSGKTPQD